MSITVLHILSGMDPKDGGPAFAIAGLGPAQAQAGLNVRVLTTYKNGDSTELCDQIAASGTTVARIGPVKGPLGCHASMTQALTNAISDCDAVHIHALWEQIQHRAARIAKKLNKPYIIRPCGMLDPWSLQQSKLKKQLAMAVRVRKNLRQASALHFTAAAERDLTSPLGLNNRSIVEPNGINLEAIDTPIDHLPPIRQTHPSLGPGPIVGFLSRVHPKKGTDLLIRAFAQLLGHWHLEHNSPPPSLLIVGPDEGGFTGTLKDLCKHLKIENHVVFTGLLTGEHKARALKSMDLFCLPSHQENFGIAVVEALAAGVPVVISDQVNIHEAITQAGVGGVTNLDVNNIAKALNKWLLDKNMRLNAAQKAREWSEQTYSWQHIANHWATQHYPNLTQTN